MRHIGYGILALALTFSSGSALAAKKPLKGKAKISQAKVKKPAAKLAKAKIKAPNMSVHTVRLKPKSTRKPASAPSGRNKPAKPSATRTASMPSMRAPSGMAGLGLTGGAGGAMQASQALEIRGQARTLSMMLILRNGKENLNFVKVRQDYATEIAKTEF